LFKLFGFVENGKEKNTSGIGLGLVISEQIVKHLDGEMSFESEEGVGSTFKFRIKL
jgi:two-component system sensor histidine kinase BarA